MDGMSLPPGFTEDGLKSQAQHIWGMLDDMATNNPAAYKQFIDKQMKEGKEAMKPPQPHMCVQTKIHGHVTVDNLFINLMEWQRVPDPKSNEDPIPVMGTKLYTDKDDDGNAHQIVSVAFSPSVMEEFGIDSDLVEERRALVYLAMDYIQDQHKIHITRNYTLLGKNARHKGSVQQAQKLLTTKTSKDDNFQKDMEELEKSFGPLATGCTDSLINQLSSIATDDSTSTSPISEHNNKTSNGNNGFNIGGPTDIILPSSHSNNTKKTGKLVEEISSEDAKVCEPPHSVTVEGEDLDGGKNVLVKITLAGVERVSQCELDISQDDLQLVVPGRYQLMLRLPHHIDPDLSHAKFHKKSASLLLTLPCR